MKVAVRSDDNGERDTDVTTDGYVQMRNHWITTAFAVVIWGVIVLMNIAALVFAGMGVA
jgi:metal iron transporter